MRLAEEEFSSLACPAECLPLQCASRDRAKLKARLFLIRCYVIFFFNKNVNKNKVATTFSRPEKLPQGRQARAKMDLDV